MNLMKRLLAYLFIVLGLGFTFNVNANHSWTESHYCIKKKGDDGKWPFYANQWGGSGKCPSGMKEVSKQKFETFKKIIDLKYVPNSIVSTTAKKNLNKDNKKKTTLECNDKDWNGNVITWRSCENNSKNKIAKAEPSQTQNLDDFQKGLLAAKNKDYREANELFEKFIKENPKDNKIALAQYWYAETFRVMQLYTDAASAYLVHYQKYYKKENAPQNLLKLGMMMIKIGEKDNGCKMINGVELQYPNASIEILNRAKYEAFKLNCPNARFIEKVSLDKNIDIEMLSKNEKTQIAKAD